MFLSNDRGVRVVVSKAMATHLGSMMRVTK